MKTDIYTLDHSANGNWPIYDADHEFLTQVPFSTENAEQVARGLVRAVNYHDRMKAVCERVVKAGDAPWEITETFDLARALLKEMEADTKENQ